MKLKEYQQFTSTININPTLNHVTCGLAAEVGEVMGVYQKYYRGDYDEDELLRRVRKEIGGLMWYVSELCNLEGLQLSDILKENYEALKSRQERGVLQGDGDFR